MKIALVHDYLAQDGGAEKVLQAFHEIYPEAPIFVLFHNQTRITNFPLENIRTSYLNFLPGIKNHFQWYLPLMPSATEHHQLQNFDVVLSSTSSFAKGVLTSPHTLHLSYCHTPTRYLWSDSRQYLADLDYNPIVKFFLPRLISKLRLWDKMSADRVDHFISNSQTVRTRIQKFYRRDSAIIHPPVSTENFYIAPQISDYFVAGGRLVPYKNLDLVVKVFNRLGWPLKIFGIGPELKRLKKIARPNIEFLGRISEAAKAELLAKAQAYLNPQIEDFGITAIEAMASGRPVIAFGQGGATETVVPNVTGTFFSAQTWESLLDTLIKFNPAAWDSLAIRAHAQNYDSALFKNKIQKHLADRYEEFKRNLRQSTQLH